MTKPISFSNFNKETNEAGLWANIHKRRKAGKAPKKPGDKGYPKTLDIESKEAFSASAIAKNLVQVMANLWVENYQAI